MMMGGLFKKTIMEINFYHSGQKKLSLNIVQLENGQIIQVRA